MNSSSTKQKNIYTRAGETIESVIQDPDKKEFDQLYNIHSLTTPLHHSTSHPHPHPHTTQHHPISTTTPHPISSTQHYTHLTITRHVME
ncbi:hypothetical protein Pmani_026190 [Petrolisthes manimaculis]|uniref:Uncharacterized protein n=1 Tax=Petrolisthes manimaculis TaxID=1843537 RepID=A0AAE1P6K6_9EUCA|nr:hypothetical protein Pmani_026190 [Petrolisthes manimaculis]